jgi:hypothetical protein
MVNSAFFVHIIHISLGFFVRFNTRSVGIYFRREYNIRISLASQISPKVDPYEPTALAFG